MWARDSELCAESPGSSARADSDSDLRSLLPVRLGKGQRRDGIGNCTGKLVT